MREVIQRVIAAEAEAKRIVAAAQAEAEQIAAEARNRTDTLVAHARADANAEAERIVDAAVRDAELEKQEQLARIAAEIEAQIRLDDPVRECVIAGALRCVCGNAS